MDIGEADPFVLKTEPQLYWEWQWAQLKTQLFQTPLKEWWHFSQLQPIDISQSL